MELMEIEFVSMTKNVPTDETTVRYMLVNLKAKEATIYLITGVTEEQAMSSDWNFDKIFKTIKL